MRRRCVGEWLHYYIYFTCFGVRLSFSEYIMTLPTVPARKSESKLKMWMSRCAKCDFKFKLRCGGEGQVRLRGAAASVPQECICSTCAKWHGWDAVAMTGAGAIQGRV